MPRSSRRRRFLIDETELTGDTMRADQTRSPGGDGMVWRARWWSAAEARPSRPPPARTAQWDGSPADDGQAGLTPLQHRMIGVGRAPAAAIVVLCAMCWRSDWAAAGLAN